MKRYFCGNAYNLTLNPILCAVTFPFVFQTWPSYIVFKLDTIFECVQNGHSYCVSRLEMSILCQHLKFLFCVQTLHSYCVSRLDISVLCPDSILIFVVRILHSYFLSKFYIPLFCSNFTFLFFVQILHPIMWSNFTFLFSI